MERGKAFINHGCSAYTARGSTRRGHRKWWVAAAHEANFDRVYLAAMRACRWIVMRPSIGVLTGGAQGDQPPPVALTAANDPARMRNGLIERRVQVVRHRCDVGTGHHRYHHHVLDQHVIQRYDH